MIRVAKLGRRPGARCMLCCAAASPKSRAEWAFQSSNAKMFLRFFHLKNISKLRPTLSLPDAEKLVHAFVSSRLDYCNALLIGIPSRGLQRLQYIQNSAARILMRVRKYDHITPILQSLHWLPVSSRIEYKIALLAHQCVHGHAPPYLKDLLIPQSSSRNLRSSNTNLLHRPKTKLRTMGDRAFSSAAPRIWNTLPNHLRATQTVHTFKRGLKTFLYKPSISFFYFFIFIIVLGIFLSRPSFCVTFLIILYLGV